MNNKFTYFRFITTTGLLFFIFALVASRSGLLSPLLQTFQACEELAILFCDFEVVIGITIIGMVLGLIIGRIYIRTKTNPPTIIFK